MKGPKCKFCGEEHFGLCPKYNKDARGALQRVAAQKPVPKPKMRPGSGGRRGA